MGVEAGRDGGGCAHAAYCDGRAAVSDPRQLAPPPREVAWGVAAMGASGGGMVPWLRRRRRPATPSVERPRVASVRLCRAMPWERRCARARSGHT